MNPEQSTQALARANEVKQARAEVKRELREGRISLADALADPRAARATLAELLKCLRRWGDLRVTRVCEKLSLNERKRVDELTEHQRELLIAAVPLPPHRIPKPSPLNCDACGIRLERPAALCGFCESELSEAA